MTSERLSRRHALAGAATVGLGVPLLAACGGDDPAEDTGGDGATAGPTINCSLPREPVLRRRRVGRPGPGDLGARGGHGRR